jgi:hypothetical protein
MGMPIYRPCMANNLAGTKLGAASHPQILSLEAVPFKGARSRVNREVYLFASLEVEDSAMGRRPSGTLPAMRWHKPTNTARITIGGKVA